MIQLQNGLQASLPFLLWLVVAGLVYLYIVTFIAAGGVAYEAWRRWQGKRGLRAQIEVEMERTAEYPEKERELRLESILQRFEGRQMARINRLRLTIRLGPSLGLVGTLIPMSHALAELANGNLPALARNMVNAFASTVFGIIVSVIAYVLAATREAWMRTDDRGLRLYAEDLLLHSGQVSEGVDEVR